MHPNTNEALGRAFFDHYEHYFREPISRELFRDNESERTIQVLGYANVFPECLVFSTLGVSHHARAIGHVAEVVIGADDGLSAVPRLAANALFFIIQNRLELRRGTSVGGIGQIDPAFALAFGKTAIYFSDCHALPPEFSTVKLGEKIVGKILMGIFLSAHEEQLLLSSGVDALEDKLTASGIDPFAIRRPSAI